MWKPTPKKVAELIRQGYGLGHGRDYLSWLRLKRGYFIPRSTHGHYICPETGRQMEIFSQGEREAMVFSRWLGARDVWEQKPIWPTAHANPLVGSPLIPTDLQLPSSSGTIQLAKIAGIRHPRYPGSDALWIVTTDLVAVFIDEFMKPSMIGIHVKPSSTTRAPEPDQRQAELAELERRGLMELGIRFIVWDEKVCPDQLSENLLRYFSDAYLPNSITAESRIEKFVDFAFTRLDHESIENILSAWSHQQRLTIEIAVRIFHHCAWTQKIPLDLSKPILHTRTCRLWDTTKRNSIRRAFLGLDAK